MNTLTKAALLGLACALAGCATESGQLRTFKIAGGDSVQLPIASGGAVATENADLKIEVTGFLVDAEAKAVIYTFGFTAKKPGNPRFVKIEDVSGAEPEVLVIDTTPHLSEGRYWKGDAEPRTKGDPRLSWVSEPGDTIKVFRFTVMTSDGRQLVMYQASVWPGASKPLLKRMLGA